VTQVLFAIFNGLTTGLAVFLVAAGITLIFGILRILNFAHGSFFMIGAYIVFSFVGTGTQSLAAFVGYSLVAGVVVGGLGYIVDLVVLRRLRHLDEATNLIATFALLMLCDGAVKLIWGLDPHTVSPPDALGSAVKLAGIYMPALSLFTIAFGVAVFLLLDLFITRMWLGKVIQSVAKDAWMANMLGINVPVIFTATVVAAFALAGFAGGLLVPNQSLSPALSQSYLLQAFIVVIIGGIGSVRGAFVASLLLGLIESLNVIVFPNQPGLAIYVAMVAFLLWRPRGLFFQASSQEAQVGGGGHDAHAGGARRRLRFGTATKIVLGLVVAALVYSVPAWANQGLMFLAGVTLIEALFALSWNLLYGVTGLAAFGHAAFFAVGAYFVGVLLKLFPGVPFLLVLAASALVGGLIACGVGAAAIRRTTGIALAILTMALGEILKIVIGYTELLGKDDGLAAIPRPVIGAFGVSLDLASGTAYYLFLCVVCTLVAGMLWWFTASQHGRVLRAIRQDAMRAEFIGVKVQRYRVLAFTVSGAVATLAGGLQAPWTQIVTPEIANVVHSTQPMLNSLLGGVGYFWGPAVGALVFGVLGYGTRTLVGISELVSGAVLLSIVLAAPSGLLGTMSALFDRVQRFKRRRPEPAAPPAGVMEGARQ
jgi:branched-chain amino acid transport system permease protein